MGYHIQGWTTDRTGWRISNLHRIRPPVLPGFPQIDPSRRPDSEPAGPATTRPVSGCGLARLVKIWTDTRGALRMSGRLVSRLTAPLAAVSVLLLTLGAG